MQEKKSEQRFRNFIPYRHITFNIFRHKKSKGNISETLGFMRFLSELLSCDDFLLVVRTASLANSVRHHKRATLAALYKIRSSHLPVCSTTVSSCLGMLILRTNCSHDHTSLKLLKISRITDILGSSSVRSQPHSPSFRFAPQTLQIPLQSS